MRNFRKISNLGKFEVLYLKVDLTVESSCLELLLRAAGENKTSGMYRGSFLLTTLLGPTPIVKLTSMRDSSTTKSFLFFRPPLKLHNRILTLVSACANHSKSHWLQPSHVPGFVSSTKAAPDNQKWLPNTALAFRLKGNFINSISERYQCRNLSGASKHCMKASFLFYFYFRF